MLRFIISILLMGLAFFIGAKLVPGVKIDGYGTALLASILVAIANATIGTVLRFFTFILDILTFGLISFIISVLMILLVNNWVAGFHTNGFIPAALLAIVVTVVQLLLDRILFGKERK